MISFFQTYLMLNIFHIPESIVLPEDTIQQQYRDFSSEDDQQLDREIAELKEKIKCVRKLKMHNTL